MRTVEYADETGRRFRTAIPADAPDSHADMGVPIGPPDLSAIEVPEDYSVQLQNALLERGILTYRDFRKKPMVVRGALNHVLKAQIRQLEAIYREG